MHINIHYMYSFLWSELISGAGASKTVPSSSAPASPRWPAPGAEASWAHIEVHLTFINLHGYEI